MVIRRRNQTTPAPSVAPQDPAAARQAAHALAAVDELRAQVNALAKTVSQAASEMSLATKAIGTNAERFTEDQRRHAGYIDVLRRHQKTLETRLATLDTEHRENLEGLNRTMRELRTMLGTAIEDQAELSARTSMSQADLARISTAAAWAMPATA